MSELEPRSSERIGELEPTEAQQAMERLEAASERPEVVENPQEQIESARKTIENQSEHHTDHHESTPQPKPVSGLDRLTNYRHTMRSVQRQMKPVARSFSQLIHQPTVERASEALEVTVLRPSVTLGATITALVIGGYFYFTAYHYGFRLRGSEFVLAMVFGGILGAIIELIWKAGRRTKH